MTGPRPQATSGRVLDATTDRETVPPSTGAEPARGRVGAGTRSALRDVVYCGAVFVWSIAGIAAAIGLVLIPCVLLLARWWAATHARLAVRMLAVDATR